MIHRPATAEPPTGEASVQLPTFLPDATRGSVRAVDAVDVAASGIEAVMVNAMHLSRRPGIRQIKRSGGLHRFAGWDGVVVSDSGGFQVLSLLRRQGKHNAIRPNGVVFRDDETGKKMDLSPAKVVEWQFALGSDVVIGLDDCTGPEDSQADQEASTERTIRWFSETAKTYRRHCEQRRMARPPLLVGVVQGGDDPARRLACIEAFVAEGASGFGFGGWPLDADGRLQIEMLAVLARSTPERAPLFALGVGKPEHLVALCQIDHRWVFDCTIPSRDGRHGRLYAFADERPATLDPEGDFYHRVYILDQEQGRDDGPIDPGCDCLTCQRYSRAFLHHLFRVKDAGAARLATIHNLRFYARLIEHLREARDAAGAEPVRLVRARSDADSSASANA